MSAFCINVKFTLIIQGDFFLICDISNLTNLQRTVPYIYLLITRRTRCLSRNKSSKSKIVRTA